MPLTEKRELGFHSTLADRFFAPPLFSHVHAGRICGRVCLFILGHLQPSHFVDLVCPLLSGLLRLIWTQPLPYAGGLSSVTASGSRLFCASHLHNVQPWPLALCFGLYFSSPVHCSCIVFFHPVLPDWFFHCHSRSQILQVIFPCASPSQSRSCPPGFCSFHSFFVFSTNFWK